MGCSPSKGSNIGTIIQAPFRKGRMLPPTPQTSPKDRLDVTGAHEGETRERKSLPKEAQVTPAKKQPVLDCGPEPSRTDKVAVQAGDCVPTPQRKDDKKQMDRQDPAEKKAAKKPKKVSKGVKVLKKKEKEKDKQPADLKVDFPEPLVKAHQAAYGFLNPSMNKYDLMLGLLEQATHTQASVQPMVAFMLLRYQEIIQALTEMTEEGENVIRDNGKHLAWPNPVKSASSPSPPPSESATVDPQPDLLQQLLQYTTQRMQNVSQTVCGIGDAALEDAAEYFSSVSDLLEEKLRTKRAVEIRLTQVLSRMETASVRKPGPEDSALFSEDSGIGAENESLPGSERHHRRGSCASAEVNRSYVPASNRRGMLRRKTSPISPSVSLSSLSSVASTCTLMAVQRKDSVLGSVSLDDGEDDEDERDVPDGRAGGRKVMFRLRSNSSPLCPEHQPCRPPPKRAVDPQNAEMTLKMKNAISGRIQFVSAQRASCKTKTADSPRTCRRRWTDDEEQTPKRPQTATPNRRPAVKKAPDAKGRRSRSADSLRSKGEDSTLLELERTQKDLSQKLQKMNRDRRTGGVNSRPAASKQHAGNSPLQSPGTSRARFSQERKVQSPKAAKDKAGQTRNACVQQEGASGHGDTTAFRSPVRATPPPSPPASPRPSSGLSRGRNSVKKLIDTFSQGIGDLDHPKVLGPLKGVRKCGVPILPGLGNVQAVLSTGVSSCRPENNVDLESLPPPSLEVLMDDSFQSVQDFVGAADDGQAKGGKSPLLRRTVVSQRLRNSVQSLLPSRGSVPQTSRMMENDPGRGMAACLHQHAKKILQAQDSAPHRPLARLTTTQPTSPAEPRDSGSLPVSGPNPDSSAGPQSCVVSAQECVAPSSLRGRMLPSTPSSTSSFNRRLPSPQTSRRQSSPTTPASPPVTRKLPTPPGHRSLPSPPPTRQNFSTPPSASSYPLKAPSPPASPKVRRWSRESSMEDLSTCSSNNARSVFCLASPSLFEAPPCPVPQPPQAWTSTGVSFVPRCSGSRGRPLVSVQGPRPFVRRSQSDRRPSVTLPPCTAGASVAETCGSEPAISSKGLEDEPGEADALWGSQSDLRAALRSISQPDLCVVGQALQRS